MISKPESKKASVVLEVRRPQEGTGRDKTSAEYSSFKGISGEALPPLKKETTELCTTACACNLRARPYVNACAK